MECGRVNTCSFNIQWACANYQEWNMYVSLNLNDSVLRPSGSRVHKHGQVDDSSERVSSVAPD